MTKPKMVLFDFGGTLCNGAFDLEKGLDALRRAAKNPECVTTEKMCSMWSVMSDFFHSHIKGVETPLDGILRGLLMRCGLVYDCSVMECGVIFDSANSEGRQPLPFIAGLLETLYKKGIRTAVISNNALSGEQLKIAVDRQLPGNKFEFVFTSADFLMSKPAPDMFEAAAKFAGVKASECWYCGDGFEPDVVGSLGAGMYAVHYCTKAETDFEEKTLDGKPYAVVKDWSVLASKVSEPG